MYVSTIGFLINVYYTDQEWSIMIDPHIFKNFTYFSQVTLAQKRDLQGQFKGVAPPPQFLRTSYATEYIRTIAVAL